MASGYGLTGGPSRCFPFWQEVLACYVVNTNADDNSGRQSAPPCWRTTTSACTTRKRSARRGPIDCQPSRTQANAGKLQAARVRQLQVAYRKAEAKASGGESAPTSGQIRNLGLLNKEEDTKKVLEKS
ncbi:hypothetical protein PG991_013605 [Apiospora marii]|uniref:Uncharacterized protein n=1 Tax=Apiospora marii TaxID=335849 RepID=A0ABR1R6U5_9PEZI